MTQGYLCGQYIVKMQFQFIIVNHSVYCKKLHRQLDPDDCVHDITHIWLLLLCKSHAHSMISNETSTHLERFLGTIPNVIHFNIETVVSQCVAMCTREIPG